MHEVIISVNQHGDLLLNNLAQSSRMEAANVYRGPPPGKELGGAQIHPPQKTTKSTKFKRGKEKEKKPGCGSMYKNTTEEPDR